MSGNYENIGWSRDNRDCLYNIFMMEELHSIVSIGGGGMSKVNLPKNKLERFNNPKVTEQYIQQFDNVLEQKEGNITYKEKNENRKGYLVEVGETGYMVLSSLSSSEYYASLYAIICSFMG